MTAEGNLVNAIIRYLWLRGCFVWRCNTGAYKPEGSTRFIRYGLKGCADVIGVTSSGRFIALEAKVGYNKQTPHQIAFEQRIKEKNGIYILARSLDDLEGIDLS